MSLKLHIVTIVLDGLPTLPTLFFNFNKLQIDWSWTIIEGAAANSNCTSWCREQNQRLSEDGTHEFLKMIAGHPRIRHIAKKWWAGGKLEMFNTALETLKEPGILLECDADEIWNPVQLQMLPNLFTSSNVNRAYFWCNYFVGPDIITISDDGYGNKRAFEWLRAWRFFPGLKFQSHEPPIFNGNSGGLLSRDVTKAAGFIFDHYAYAFENQVAYKEQFYGYRNAVEHWRRLQANKMWPTELSQFLPWADKGTIVDKLKIQL